MRVLLTGGTGMVGSAVLAEFIRAGHYVTAAVRSASSAAAVEALGATAVRVPLTDAAALADLLSSHDATIHAAAPSIDPGGANEAFVTAVLTTNRPAVLTGGTWVHGSGDITDDSPLRPPEQVAWRVPSEERLLAGSPLATVLEPGIVHGGRTGLLELLTDGPVDEHGRRRLIGDGSQRWSWVHAADLADLYRRVVESGVGHGRLLAARPGPPVGDIVRAVYGSEGVVTEAVAMTQMRFGAVFANALLLDQSVRSAKADALGWLPQWAVPG